MKRTLITALLPLAVTSLVLAGGATPSGAEDATTNGRCSLPTAERSYTPGDFVYRLAIDLTDCDWWDGSPVRLDASIERVDPAGGHGAGSFVMCGAGRALSETPDPNGAASTGASPDQGADDQVDANDAPAQSAAEPRISRTGLRSGACAVEVSMEHASPETAHYTGEITFPWRGVRRTVSFNALCGGDAVGCVDLPVDPMTTLAPLGDAIDGIGNGN